MANPLQSLFQVIAQAQNERELRQSTIARVGEYFTAVHCGLSFLNEFPAINANTSDIIKLALSLDHNPILRYLVDRHAPVHEGVILPPEVWQTICPRADHGHVMIGPIVHKSLLIGGVAFTRHRDHPAFDAQNLVDLSALCLHLSTQLAELRSQSTAITLVNHTRLTPRETQIAKLVAQGLTSREIGATLWITDNSVRQALKRMFRKLKVSSRAEMIAQLSSLRNKAD